LIAGKGPMTLGDFPRSQVQSNRRTYLERHHLQEQEVQQKRKQSLSQYFSPTGELNADMQSMSLGNAGTNSISPNNNNFTNNDHTMSTGESALEQKLQLLVSWGHETANFTLRTKIKALQQQILHSNNVEEVLKIAQEISSLKPVSSKAYRSLVGYIYFRK
jgi:hypothetical protein